MTKHFEDNVRKSLKERISEYAEKQIKTQTKMIYRGDCESYDEFVHCLKNIQYLKSITDIILSKCNSRKEVLQLCDTTSRVVKDSFFDASISNYGDYITLTNKLEHLANIRDIAKGETNDELEDNNMSFYNFTVQING